MAEQTVIPGTNVLEVRNLNKKYPSFELRDVSFTIKPGQITGFIGRNGAGKSTTLNSIFNMIPRDSGDISYFGLDFKTHERDIKQRVGFVSSGISYYPSAPSMCRDKEKKLKETGTAIYEQCGLPVFIAEYAYPSGPMKGPFAAWVQKTGNYEHDQQGQASLYADVIAWGKTHHMAGIR